PAPGEVDRPARVGGGAVELVADALTPHQAEPVAEIAPDPVERTITRFAGPAGPRRPRDQHQGQVKEVLAPTREPARGKQRGQFTPGGDGQQRYGRGAARRQVVEHTDGDRRGEEEDAEGV